MTHPVGEPQGRGPAIAPDIAAPVIVAGRGGSGTRMFSAVLQRLGVFLGNRINQTEDSLEWVPLIYRIAMAGLQEPPAPAAWRDEILANAAAILAAAGNREIPAWGWKLPETMLALPEMAEAFPRARFIHVVRHPLDTCLRRSHKTSRPGDPVGRAVLAAAYRRMGWSSNPAEDAEHRCNAASWRYQVEAATEFFAGLPEERVLTVRYEALCDQPGGTIARIARFVGVEPGAEPPAVEQARRRLWSRGDERIAEVWDICGDIARHHGYSADGGVDPA